MPLRLPRRVLHAPCLAARCALYDERLRVGVFVCPHRRNNHTDQRSYHLYYLPWDAPSSSADELKYRKESLFVPMTGVPKKVKQNSDDTARACRIVNKRMYGVFF